ncbi:hypothetical protein VIGAN_02253600, partial [Vigna angularis var. angularis]
MILSMTIPKSPVFDHEQLGSASASDAQACRSVSNFPMTDSQWKGNHCEKPRHTKEKCWKLRGKSEGQSRPLFKK